LPPTRGWKFAGGVIEPGEALFYLPEKDWKYQFAYRNIVTGHVSDATPDIARLVHNFYSPEMDVMDIYRQLNKGEIHYHQTILGVKG
jgi:hypothetical protein